MRFSGWQNPGNRLDVLIARDEKHPEKGKCMLVVLKQDADIHKFLPFLAAQQENAPCDDFLGYFPREGRLYIVFRFYDYMTLSERLSSDTGFEERVMIAGNILRRIVILNLPTYLQYEVLGEGNILAGKNGDIRFSYGFHELDRFDSITERDVIERLTGVLKKIFPEELEKHSCPPLEQFFERIEKEKFPGIAAVLREYDITARAAPDASGGGKDQTEKLWFPVVGEDKETCPRFKIPSSGTCDRSARGISGLYDPLSVKEGGGGNEL